MENISSKELLTTLQARLKMVEQFLLEQFIDITEDQFNQVPAPKKWSAGQCFEHLVHVNQLYMAKLPSVIKKAKSLQKVDSAIQIFKSNWMGRFLYKSVNPANLKPVSAPGAFKIKATQVSLNKIKELILQVQQWIQLMQLAENVDLIKTKMSSPALFIIVLRLGDIFTINTYHIERHLNQALRAMKMNPVF